jgi:hypothetical protein
VYLTVVSFYAGILFPFFICNIWVCVCVLIAASLFIADFIRVYFGNRFFLRHVGQTGRTFNTRYKEHIYEIKSNNSNTGYSRRILDTGHTYGIMEDTMDIVRIGRTQ